tara:strand:- start:1405 stop:2025 length:621 start_codon:yes stop_codon:yes gene_type:complete
MNTVDNAAVERVIHDSISVKQAIVEDAELVGAIVRVTNRVVACLKAGNKVLIAGNGGSAADAQHIAAEFVSRFEFDRPGLPALALTTDTSALTAIGNDYGYEQIFSRQVQALARPQDLFIGISTSGNSANILRAVQVCREMQVFSVALCGNKGKLPALCDDVIAVPSAHTPRIQEAHSLIGHIICGLAEEAIWGQQYKPKAAPESH